MSSVCDHFIIKYNRKCSNCQVADVSIREIIVTKSPIPTHTYSLLWECGSCFSHWSESVELTHKQYLRDRDTVARLSKEAVCIWPHCVGDAPNFVKKITRVD